ncbi:hypothetical protein FH603_138 [Spirosoma sp. LMG 31447]|uniref:Uncharacterized protein n=1 Tax=Spirosoma utsteinense TaxID=2585773 RepID=A0ABR6W183_9BACT|nr:hypothetical protein [Spirosoma utsteinense]
MQLSNYRHIGNTTSTQPISNWTFFRKTVRQFIINHAEAFKGLSRMAAPHGGSIGTR